VKKINYVICCSDPEFRKEPATYKIAAEWTGGGFTELKTFGFANDACLDRVMRAAIERAKKIRLAEGESLGSMRIYRLDATKHDYELTPAPELEKRFSS
jgi:hypothetical protein